MTAEMLSLPCSTVATWRCWRSGWAATCWRRLVRDEPDPDAAALDRSDDERRAVVVEPREHDVARLVAGVAPVGVDERRRELRRLGLGVGLVGRVELALRVGRVTQAVLGGDALPPVDEALGDRAVEVGPDRGEHEDAEEHRHDDDAEAEGGPPQVEQPAPRAAQHRTDPRGQARGSGAGRGLTHVRSGRPCNRHHARSRRSRAARGRARSWSAGAARGR